MSASTGALINAATVARLAIPAIKLTFFIQLPSDDRSLSHCGRPAPAPSSNCHAVRACFLFHQSLARCLTPHTPAFTAYSVSLFDTVNRVARVANELTAQVPI